MKRVTLLIFVTFIEGYGNFKDKFISFSFDQEEFLFLGQVQEILGHPGGKCYSICTFSNSDKPVPARFLFFFVLRGVKLLNTHKCLTLKFLIFL